MASFDASSAVPDSLVLAGQADRLARQATGTVMAGARPLGDRSNGNAAAAPGGVEALVKRYGTSKAPRRICSGCVALRNEGEGLKREVLRLRHGMRAMVVRLEALEGAAARAATARAARRERARGLGAAPPPADARPASPPPAAARPASPTPVAPARTTPQARATLPATPPPDAPRPPAMPLPTAAAWPPETPADRWPPEPAAAARPGWSVVAGWGSATRVVAPGPGTPDAPPPAYSPPRRGRTYSPQRESSCVSSGVLDALHAILGCDRAALADEATQVSCELLKEAAAQGRAARTGCPTFGVALYERVAARLTPERRAHRHRFNLTPEPRPPAGPPPSPDPAAQIYEEPAAPPDGAVAQ